MRDNLSINIDSRLQIRWVNLLKNIHVKDVLAAEAFAQISSEYTKPHRYYHTLTHVDNVLNTIENLQVNGQDLVSLQLAAWFHDVVYDSQAPDNEIKSAEFASQLLQKLFFKNLSIAHLIIQRVRELILLTQSHQVIENDIDGKIFLDADLSILGSPWSKYWQYAQDIRQEYAWINYQDYRIARTNILQNFLARSQIYFYLHELEDKARSNMAREIELLNCDDNFLI